MALQYGVPLESLVKKFAYQRFEPIGLHQESRYPQRHVSITDYVFRWLGCQFIKGYKEATSPNRGQPELPMKEIAEIEKKAVNRPVPDLPRTGEKEVIDVITGHAPNEGSPARGGQRPHPRRPRPGSARQHVHGHHLLALRQQQGDPRRRLRCLHRVRHQPGVRVINDRESHRLTRSWSRRLSGRRGGDARR